EGGDGNAGASWISTQTVRRESSFDPRMTGKLHGGLPKPFDPVINDERTKKGEAEQKHEHSNNPHAELLDGPLERRLKKNEDRRLFVRPPRAPLAPTTSRTNFLPRNRSPLESMPPQESIATTRRAAFPNSEACRSLFFFGLPKLIRCCRSGRSRRRAQSS